MSDRLSKSQGFKTGRHYYRNYVSNKAEKSERLETENPFEPGYTNYDDFWDGWAYERDLHENQKIEARQQRR